MHPRIRFLALATIVALLCGCEETAPRLIRVTVEHAGASPQEVADALAAPLEAAFRGLPDVESITSISSAGRLETYVETTRGSRPREVLARIVRKLPEKQLPDDAAAPLVDLLPKTATITAVKPKDTDYIVIDLDRKAIAKNGIPMRQVLSAIEKQAAGSAADMSRLAKLRAVQVAAPDDRVVPLTELAEIRVEKQPSHIVTH